MMQVNYIDLMSVGELAGVMGSIRVNIYICEFDLSAASTETELRKRDKKYSK